MVRRRTRTGSAAIEQFYFVVAVVVVFRFISGRETGRTVDRRALTALGARRDSDKCGTGVAVGIVDRDGDDHSSIRISIKVEK